MNEDYFRRLSPAVQRLVDEVEAAAGIDVAIKQDATRAGRGPDGDGIMACDIDERGATLLVPGEQYFPDGAVVHEMLHTRRLLVDKVPRVSENTASRHWNERVCKALTDLDNALEHLVIVPEEIQRHPERVDRWSRVMERTWRVDVPAIADPDDRRRWALIHWAFLKLVLPDSPALDFADEVLANLALSIDARDFLDAVAPRLGSKEDLIRACIEHLRLPRDIGVFEYYDSHRRQVREALIFD